MNNKNRNPYSVSVEEAANQILTVIPYELREAIAKSPQEKLVTFHGSLGLYIRNHYSLWESYRGNENELAHPDYYSFFVIKRMWEMLQIEHSYEGI